MNERTPTTLRALAEQLGARLEGVDSGAFVLDVEQDSRRVTPGALFVVRAGSRADGAEFVAQAVERGAVGVLALEGANVPPVSVPVLRVGELPTALLAASQLVHGAPFEELSLLGVTGTNGKTTSTFLIAAMLDALGSRCARVGTLGYGCGEDVEDGRLTTPPADELVRWAARARRAGAKALVTEVSSHALDQHRVDGLHFRVAAFTNLTQDHLDYHGSMERYFEAKARLFTELAPEHCVLVVDGPYGARLAERVRHPLRASVRADGDAELRVIRASLGRDGIIAELATPAGPAELRSPLVGAFNLENLLVAVGVGLALGHEPSAVTAALAHAGGVPGRLERCDGPDDDLTVLVDYAHTPDALARALAAVRPLTSGAVTCVFGCGGDRDPGKRPLMGSAAARGAERVVVTSDNPRTERPDSIIEAILAGMAGEDAPRSLLVEPDRRAALRAAVLAAAPGDVVLLAGKGHEPYQLIGTQSFPFDDRLEARAALVERRARPRTR